MNLFEDLAIPIIQAPMVGAVECDMVVAVSKAGGLGTLGCAAMSPDEIAAAARDIGSKTFAPFGLNLLITRPTKPSAQTLDAALECLRPWYERVGAPVPELPERFAHDFSAQLAAVAKARPAIASFAFDILTREEMALLKGNGIKVMGTANSVAEALAWRDVGADFVCAQGFEAGGHRGAFLTAQDEALVGTLPLVATCLAAVDIPVIAAGGIMDGRGVAAALALGAAATQMGTAFLLADQSTANPVWKKALAESPPDATRLTRAISGRYARGIENDFMRDLRSVEKDVPAYPVQNRLTLALRAAATANGDPSVLSLWAGQAYPLARTGDAGEMVKAWWQEARETAKSLVARTR